MIFRPPMKQAQAEATETATAPPLEVEKSAEDLRQKLAERRKQAEDSGLKDASELLKKLEEGTQELQKQPDREKALAKVNDLARELEERRKQLGGGSESLKRELEKVQDIANGPADELAKALSKGDFEKAAQALEKLQKQLSESKLDSTKKEDLTKQWSNSSRRSSRWPSTAKDAQADLQKRADQMNRRATPPLPASWKTPSRSSNSRARKCKPCRTSPTS